MKERIYQAPVDLSLGAVTLRVSDLKLETDFYSQFLGMEILEQANHRVKLGFKSGLSLVNLIKDPDAVPRPRNAAGLYHFALLTPSRERLAHALRVLLDSGYSLQGFADHFVSEAIYLSDPEGNGIEIYADRPRESWQWDGDQVRIGTVALDIESLLALAGDDQQEAGVLSPGTVVGHIHLQVSNLAAAMEFYDQSLGFDSMGYFGSSAAFYSSGGYHHHIGLNTWASAGGPHASTHMLGLGHFEIIYHRQEEVAILADVLGMNAMLHGGSEGILIKDPSGIVINVRSEN